jgi:hypothetical protein
MNERLQKLKDFAEVGGNLYLFKELQELEKEIKLEILKVKLKLKQ